MAPGGAWSRLAWTNAGAVLPLEATQVGIYGWNGGFVAVGASGGDLSPEGSPQPLAFAVTSSLDGLHWSAAQTMKVSGLDGGDRVAQLVQGPTGLLLIGRPFGDTCGGPPVVAGLWSSSDGTAWRRVTWPKAFGSNRVQTLDAGSAGYIATGIRTDGQTPAIWLSNDGVAWRSAPLPRISSGRLVVNGATSFADGLVVAGAVLGPDGCGGASSLHPSVWWSANGTSWAREALPGASSAADASMTVLRVTDRSLMAFESSGTTGDRAWRSQDGRAWALVASPPSLVSYRLVTDGRHAVAVLEPESGSGLPAIIAVHEAVPPTTLVQTGDGPVASGDGPGWTSAVGPTGIVVAREDGGALWLGRPSN